VLRKIRTNSEHLFVHDLDIFGRTNPFDLIRRPQPPFSGSFAPPDSLGFFRPTCVNADPRHDPVRAAQSSRAPGSQQCFRNETNAAKARVLGSRFGLAFWARVLSSRFCPDIIRMEPRVLKFHAGQNFLQAKIFWSHPRPQDREREFCPGAGILRRYHARVTPIRFHDAIS